MKALHRIVFVFVLLSRTAYVPAQEVNSPLTTEKAILLADTIVASIDEINSSYADYAAFVLPGDSILLFTSRRKPEVLPGSILNLSSENIWWTKKHAGNWDPSVKSLHSINKLGNSSMAGISPDATAFYIYTDRNNGDIFMCRIDSMLSRPVPIKGDINTQFRETSIALIQNSRVCYFCSDRTDLENFGGMDIFRAEKDSTGAWINIQNAGDRVNTEYDENYVSYSLIDSVLWFSSNRPEGRGAYDIYGSKLTMEDRLDPPINIGHPINTEFNDIYWYKYGHRAMYSSFTKDSAENIFEVIFPDIEALKNAPPVIEYNFNDILFAIGSGNISNQTLKLDGLSSLLLRLPGLKICISGYTDSLTGNTKTNNLLSLQRATNVAKYLISNGVDPNQLRVEAGGSKNPISTIPELNRRVVLTIIEQDRNAIVKIIRADQNN